MPMSTFTQVRQTQGVQCKGQYARVLRVAIFMIGIMTFATTNALPAGMAVDPYYLKDHTTNLESYVKVFGGVNYSPKIRGLDMRGGATGWSGQHLDLKSSALYGAKLGVFPWEWIGLEAELFNSVSLSKVQEQSFFSPTGSFCCVRATIPGIGVRATVLAFNAIIRYPGKLLQPYAGIGPGLFFMRGKGPFGSDSDTSLGLNALAGLNFRISEQFGVFAEYKYNRVKVQFDNLFDAGGVIGPVGFKGTYSSHALVVGLGWHF
jgi:opacity protein-like surface antigen